MKKLVIAIGIMFSLTMVAVFATSLEVIKGSDMKFSLKQDFMGKSYITTISKNDVPKVPAWDPEKDACPLDTMKAAALAKSYLTKKFPIVTQWELNGIELRQHHLVGGEYEEHVLRWIYLVRFRNKNKAFLVTYVSVAVSLNGHVFPLVETAGKADCSTASTAEGKYTTDERMKLMKQSINKKTK